MYVVTYTCIHRRMYIKCPFGKKKKKTKQRKSKAEYAKWKNIIANNVQLAMH